MQAESLDISEGSVGVQGRTGWTGRSFHGSRLTLSTYDYSPRIMMGQSRRQSESDGELRPQPTAEIDEPPTNDAGEYVCSRRCANGTRCLITVSLPFISCHQHDQSKAVVTDGE